MAATLGSGAAEVSRDFWLIDLLVLLYLVAVVGIFLSVLALAPPFSRAAPVALLLNAAGLTLLLVLPLIEPRS